MSASEPFRGVKHLFKMALDRVFVPERFGCPRLALHPNPNLPPSHGWNDYWERSGKSKNNIYKSIATTYRRAVITPRLTFEIKKTFQTGDSLLHAGCGSGHVDRFIQSSMKITAVDSSLQALDIYRRNVPNASTITHASVFNLPFGTAEFDGAYHLGVIEHFNSTETTKFLNEMHRTIKPGGQMLIFWPHQNATSVFVLKIWNWVACKISTPLHPPEISLAKNKKSVARVLEAHGFKMTYYSFGVRDFWVQAVIRATRVGNESLPAPSPQPMSQKT